MKKASTSLAKPSSSEEVVPDPKKSKKLRKSAPKDDAQAVRSVFGFFASALSTQEAEKVASMVCHSNIAVGYCLPRRKPIPRLPVGTFSFGMQMISLTSEKSLWLVVDSERRTLALVQMDESIRPVYRM